jgi:hypothetical protein
MTVPPPLDLRRDGAGLAFVLLVSLALQLLIFDRWMSLLDEGAIVQIADQIRDGKHLYRHAVHVAFPGVFYLTAALFEIFGPSLLVGRYLMVGVFSAFVILVYVLARTVVGRGVSVAAALFAVSYRIWAFPHWHMVSYTPLAMLWLLVGVAILALDVRRPRPFLPPLAGLAVGIAITFKQDFTTVALGTLSLFVLATASAGTASRSRAAAFRYAFARACSFGAAGLVPPAAAVLAFAPAGLSLEVLLQTIWFPLVRQPVWATSLGGDPHPYISFPPLWPPWGATDDIRRFGYFSYFPPLLLDLYWKEFITSSVFRNTTLPEIFVRSVYVLPYLLLAVFVGRELWSVRAGRVPTPAPLHVRHLRLILVLGVALMISFNRPRDWIHLMILYPATLILLAVLAELLAGGAPGPRRRLVMGMGATITGVVVVGAFAAALVARTFYAHPLASPRAGVLVTADQVAVLDRLVGDLARGTDRERVPLASLPYNPLLNFLADRPLATRFLTLLPLEEFPDRQEQVLADLARDPRTEIVYSLQHASAIPRPQQYMPKVFAALVDRYQLGAGPGQVYSGTITDGLLFARLVPRPPLEETVVYDFSTHLAAATVEDLDGFAPTGKRPAGGDPRVGLDVWPFEDPVLWLTPQSPPGYTRLEFSVAVPRPARLRAGVAMNPDEWTHFLQCAVQFVVRIDGSVVYDTTLDPRRKFVDRRWAWVDVALEPADRRRIAFEVRTDNGFGAVSHLAGWARPRLVADGGH